MDNVGQDGFKSSFKKDKIDEKRRLYRTGWELFSYQVMFRFRVILSGSGLAEKSGSNPENPDRGPREKRAKNCKYNFFLNYIIFWTFSTILFLSGSSKPNQRISFTVYTSLIC